MSSSCKDPERSYKRWFDLTVLLISHLFPPFWPVWVILWTLIPLAIKLEDGGSIFFKQRRVGKNGRTFTVTKFRTMMEGAQDAGPAWTLDGDKRVTKVGHILRKRSLDEIPQTLSIWKGDMSFVGPRALAVQEHEYIEKKIPKFGQRLKIRPGLTGLAQVYNTGDESEAKLQYDLEYMRRMNPLLDLKLLMLSVRGGVFGKWDRRGEKSGG